MAVPKSNRNRVIAASLVVSVAGLVATFKDEGWSSKPIIPVDGDRPTIGHGSTTYEDGTPVKLNDPAITRERGAQIARNHVSKDEAAFKRSTGDIKLYQEEYDLYLDFSYQYGVGAWNASSMLKSLRAGNYAQACHGLLEYRKIRRRNAQGNLYFYDCSTPGNKICRGVWTRQVERHKKCMEAQ